MQNRTFKRNTNYDINKGYENLAIAVVAQAVRDFHKYKRKINKGKMTPYDYTKFNELVKFFYDDDSMITLYTSLPADILLKEGAKNE